MRLDNSIHVYKIFDRPSVSVSLTYVLRSPAQCQTLFESYWLCWWTLCLAFLSCLIKLSPWELIFEFRIIFLCVCEMQDILSLYFRYSWNVWKLNSISIRFCIVSFEVVVKNKNKVISVFYVSRIYFHIWILIKLSIRKYIGLLFHKFIYRSKCDQILAIISLFKASLKVC